MNVNQVHKLADRIQGWFTHNEGDLLFKLASKCPPNGVIVEIGSWKGKSTVYLAKGSENHGKNRIYAIDPFLTEDNKIWGEGSTYKTFLRNMKRSGTQKRIKTLVMTSRQAVKMVKEPVALLFVDGDHRYPGVKLDFDHWFPKLINGGYIAFHDTFVYPGPKKVVADDVFGSGRFKHIRFVDSITCAQKTDYLKLPDRLSNTYIFVLKYIYGLLAGMPLPLPVAVLGKKAATLIQH